MPNKKLTVLNGQYFDPDVGLVKKHVYSSKTGHHREHAPTDKYIKGPIPFAWLQAANSLPGKAGQVGIALWFLAGVKGTKTVKVTAESIHLAGCSRQTFQKGLIALDAAGLISFQQKPGVRALVTIENFPEDAIKVTTAG